MPRLSARFIALRALTAATRRIRQIFLIVNFFDLIAGDFSGLTEQNESFLALLQFQCRLEELRETRYITKRKFRKYDRYIYERDLDDRSDVPWLTEDEFLQKYRTSRAGVHHLVELLKDAPVFKPGKRGTKMMPVTYQVMIWLHFFGHEGMSLKMQREVLHTCNGILQNARDRVTEAFNHIRDDWIYWPNAEERKTISKRIENEYFLPNCVGLMDGTLFRLAFEPRCFDKADYHGRKYQYSLTCNVICDDECIIRDYLAGFPGSTHDSRVWRHQDIYNNPTQYFLPSEYVLTDTAFEPTWFCIPAYKCIGGNHLLLPPDKTEFNFCLARPRVRSEHVMGIWKGRCPWLRSIRMFLTDDPESMEKILKAIDATIVFHNIMMKFNKDELPGDVDLDAASIITAIDDPDRVPLPEERIVLDEAIADGAATDTRRTQLLRYVREFYVRPAYGSPASTVYCDSPDAASLGDLSLDEDDLVISDENVE